MTQRNVEEAARTAGIGTRTLLRWLKIPEFAAAYREARRLAFGQSIAQLQQATRWRLSPKSFGYPTFSVNRQNQPAEELGVAPDV